MEALSASEEKYHYMFANNPQVMWIYDLETLAFLEVNDAAILRYGYTKEEFLSMTLKEIRPKEDIGALLKDVEQTRGAYNPGGQWRHLKKNGELMHVEIISHSITFNGRDARHVMVNDITERKRGEGALRASEVRYRRLFEAARDGILILDAETGAVVDVNPFLIEMLSYSREEFLGKKLWELGFFKDIAANQENLEELQRNDYIRYDDLPLETADGRRMQVEFVSNIYVVEGRKVIQCNIRDISERKRADKALRESEERERLRSEELSALLDAMPAAVWITHDPAALQMTSNRLGTEWTRIPEGSNVSKSAPSGERPETFKACKNGKEIPPEELPVQMAARGKEVRDYEFDLEYPDGILRHLLGSATPLKDDRGQPRGAVSAFIDITERKRAEEEVRRLNAELEQRVAERTAELSVTNQELESFAYSVSHDLRAPLRGIDGWSHALLDDYGKVLDRTATGYLDTIRAEAQRMSELIDAMLQLSKLTRSDLVKTTVGLAEVARSIEAGLRDEEAGREVEFVLAPDLGEVEGDSHLVRVILQNLLRNAWKFTRKREHARVEFGVNREDGHAAYFVRDNGAGFDMAYAQKLFLPFQRLHHVDEFPGLGVGLATVQRIVQRHGGTIWAEGEVGKGATFYFTLGEQARVRSEE
jgi:PAS domain S-box-containing protein